MALTISREHYPVILRRFSGVISDAQQLEDLELLSRDLAGEIERGDKIVSIFDLSTAPPLTPRQRKVQSDWLIKNTLMIRRVSLGTGFYVVSPIVQCIVTAIFWLAPPPDEYTVSADPRVIVDWAGKRLKAHGLQAPPSLARALIRKAA